MAESKIPKHPEKKKPSWLSTHKAKEEDINWEDENTLKGQKLKNQFYFTKTIGVIALIVISVFSIIFLTAFVVWALHFILPDSRHWLSPEQLSKIQSMIFSGAMGAIVSSYLKKQVN